MSTTSFQPLIDRIIAIAQTAAGTDGRVIPLNSLRNDTTSEKDPSLVAQDAVIRPIFEIEDIVPESHPSRYGEHASTALYLLKIVLKITYKSNKTLPDFNRNTLVGTIRNDMHIVRRALCNPGTFDSDATGVVGVDFIRSNPIIWNTPAGLASQTLEFSAHCYLDFVA